MFKTDRIVIEKDKRLSESALWTMQQDYFEKRGVYAWVEDVPLYITSNPFLANGYAEMAVRLVQSWILKYPASRSKPFYILELGTGSGKLSFYILKRIKELQQQLHMEDVAIRYIMSDFTESNISYWNTHPALQEYVDSQLLDFALFNMVTDKTLHLIKSGITLSPGSFDTPMTVFVNYVFDTVSHDAFVVEDGQLYAELTNLTTSAENMDNGKVMRMEAVQITHTKEPIAGDYYPDDSTLNKVLNEYKTTLNHSHFLIPLTGLKTIVNLKELCQDKLFLVSTDKGCSSLQELEGLEQPDFAHHGSFSVMVNFHAIQRYVEIMGGTAVIQTPRADIKTAAFCLGISLTDLPEFSNSIYEHIERLSPADYFILHRNISENFQHCKVKTLVSHLAFTRWDPHIYEKLARQINEQIMQAEQVTIDYLVSHVSDLAAHFYYMPKTYDVMFDIAFLLHILHRYGDAITYYEQSRHYYGDQFTVLYNLGLCYYQVGLHEQALEKFKQALERNPDAKEVQAWVTFMEKEKE